MRIVLNSFGQHSIPILRNTRAGEMGIRIPVISNRTKNNLRQKLARHLHSQNMWYIDPACPQSRQHKGELVDDKECIHTGV